MRIDCFEKIKHKEVKKQLQQVFNDLVTDDMSEQEQKEIGKKIAVDYYSQVNEELAGLKENILTKKAELPTSLKNIIGKGISSDDYFTDKVKSVEKNSRGFVITDNKDQKINVIFDRGQLWTDAIQDEKIKGLPKVPRPVYVQSSDGWQPIGKIAEKVENKQIEKIEQEAEKEIKKVDPKLPPSKLPVKARVAQRKVRDEKAAADLKAKLLALKNLGKNGGITLTSGGFDPKKFELATEIIAGYIKQGVYKFSDIIEDAYAAMGEGVKELYDMLKSAYGGYYMAGADQMDAEQMDLSERNLTFDEITHDMSSEEVELEDFEKVENSESRRQFIDIVKGKIKNQEKQNIVSLRKLAADLGIDVVDTNLQEMVEMAVVELSRDMANKSWQEKYILEGIIDIYDNQPTISMRSANRIELQQYSTPAPTAYIAGLYVAAGKPGSVFEPSAGNGIMTIAFKPGIVSVNEIDPVRLDNLAGQGFQQVTNQDALQPFSKGRKFGGLVMNPPFGSSEQIEVNGYKISGLAQKMAINALTNLKPNGRAAIIIGGHNEYDEKGRITSERTFFNWLYNQYNVAAVINISGELYAKQGTQFPTRLILIHSKKAVAEGATPINKENQVVTSYYELLKIVNALKDATYENIFQPGLDADRNDGDAIHGEGADQLQPNNEGGLPPVSAGQVRQNSSGRPSSKGNTGLNNGNVEGANSSESDTNGIGADNNADGRISDMEADVSEQQQGTGNIGGTGIGNISRNQSLQSPRKFEAGELTQNEKVPYVPKSSSQSVDTVIPSRMATDAENILTKIDNEYGGIDNFVQQRLDYKTKEELFTALSGEQVDAVAMAIVQIENGQAMIIGDQTGVGKGRTAAAILRYSILNGYKPVFLTQYAELFSDLYRDLVDIDPSPNAGKEGSWSRSMVPFIFNDKGEKDPTITDAEGNVVHKLIPPTAKKSIYKSGKLPENTKFVLASYSQFGTSQDKPSVKKDFFRNITEGQILILDESHNVAGQSNRGEFFKEIIATSKGVLYLSATFAKTPQAMPVYAMKTAMQEANMSSAELVGAIERGGVALQEVIAAQLVESGQMLRRERSYKGVSVDYEILEEVGPQHREIADKVTEIIRDVIDFQATHVAEVINTLDDIAVAAGARMTPRDGTNMAGVNNTPFASKVFNVIDQLLFSIKALESADAAIEELKANRKPVIGFKSTMASFLDHIGVQVGEKLGKIDFSLTLKRALEGVMKYTEKDEQGNSRPGTISLADLSEEGREEYQKIMDKILKASSGITISPIDVIRKRIQDAGYTVKEITGRDIMLDIQDDGSAVVVTRFDKDKKKIVREFNNGELDVVLLNMSGATGISMHASSKFKDQRQRVMIDVQLELDINAAVQKRGRIDRVGQVVRGAYRYIVSAIPAETRLLMMFKKKLASLDANTTSSQKSIKTADIADFLNKYGDEVVTEYLKENRELNDKMLDPLGFNKMSDEDLDGLAKIEDAALKATGRVAFLQTKEQTEFYKEVSERYTDYIEYLESNNSNDLKVSTLPLNAKTLTSDIIVEGRGGDSPFGNPSVLEQIETDVLTKPLKKEDIDKQLVEGLDGLTPEQKNTEVSDGIHNYYDGVIEQGIAKLEAQHEKNKISVARNAREKAIENGSQDVEGDVEGALERLEFAKNQAINRLETRTNFIKNHLSRFAAYFKIGNLYEVPISVRTSTTIGTSKGVFLGFGIKKNRKNPYAPSAINMRFAVNDSRRIVSIPLSKNDFINAVMANSQYLTPQVRQNYIDNWDSLQSTRTRENRFMVTGNLLQAYGTNDGHLVTYTDEQGNLLKGILLPESYKVQEQKRRIPINQAAPYLEKRGSFITTIDIDVVIKKESTGYTITVPLTKKAGGKYFLNKGLQALVNERGFNQMAGKMTAYFSDSKLQDILDLLYREYNSSIEVDSKINKAELRKEEKAEPEPDVVEEDKDEDLVEVLVQRAKDEFPNVPEAFFGPYRNLLATELLPNIPHGSVHRHLLKRMSQFQVNTPETQAMHDVIELASRMIDAKEDDSNDMFLHDDKELGDHFLINAWGETAKVSLQNKRSYRDFGDQDDKELGAYFEMPLEFATGVNQEAIFNSYLFFRDAYNFFRKSNPDFSVSEPVSEEVQDIIDAIQEEVDNGVLSLKAIQDKIADAYDDDSEELKNKVTEAYNEYTKRFTPDEINQAINKRLSDNLSAAFGGKDKVQVVNDEDIIPLVNQLGDVTFNATPEQQATQELLDNAKAEYQTAKKAFEAKRKALDKAIGADQADLFGERPKAPAPGLFDERVSQSGRDKAMEPFKARMAKAENEVNRLQKKLDNLGNQTAQTALFNTTGYHGTPSRFDSFTTNQIGNGDGRLIGGWGLYFSSKKDVAAEYALKGGMLATVDIKDDNFFDLDAPISDTDKSKIIDEISEILDEDDLEELKTDYLGEGDKGYNVATGRQFLEWLTVLLKSPKAASMFIKKRLGYDGNIFRDRWDNDAKNYVVFDENNISIKNKIQFHVAVPDDSIMPDVVKSPDGKILGFTHNGKIYLNAKHLNPNTPIHEAGHIWTEWAKQYSKAVYNRGIELVTGSKYYEKVTANKTYQGLAKQEALKAGAVGSLEYVKAYDTYMKHEALAMAIGDRGAQFVTESKKKGFAEWLKNLWENIKNAVGFKNITAAELSNLTFDEFTSMAAADILREREPGAQQQQAEPELTEEEQQEEQEQQDWENSDPIADYEMTTSGEVGQMLSGKTIADIFGDAPEGDQSYDKQIIVDMLQDGKNMIGAAMGKWGSDLADYGRPLFNYIKNMSTDVSLMAKKVALMGTFLGEIKEEINRNPKRMDELRHLENAVTAYYQNYMMNTAKSLSAGRILRLYRDKYMGDIFAHQILEEQEIRDQNTLRKLQAEQMDIEARVAAGIEEFKAITQAEKDIADAEAAEKDNDAKVKQKGKKNMAPTDAQKAAAAKAEKIKKNGRLDSIVDRIKNAINKCK